MSYRGRLIFPMAVDIYRLDTEATEAAAGDGDVANGYDPDFLEPVMRDQGPDLPDVVVRQEVLVDLLPCQIIPEKGNYEALQMMVSGHSKSYSLRVAVHYLELETRGLIDTDGSPLIKVNDRLAAIRQTDGTLLRAFNSPQLFATQVQDRSFGLSGLRRNLLMVTFEERDNSTLSV